MKYQEIKQARQDKQTELFNKIGLFFAFSNEQFHENKTPLKEGEKYVSIGCGGYLPKSNLEAFKIGIKELDKWEKQEIKKSKELDNAIKFEINNYECFYTHDLDPVFNLFPEVKKEHIRNLFNEVLTTVNF